MCQLKIGIITSNLNIGGEQKVLFNWVTTLDKKRFLPVVFCFYENGAIGEELKKRGIRIIYNVFRSKFDIKGIFRLKEAIKSEEIDVIYLSNKSIVLFYFGIFLSHRWRNQIITAFHSWYYYLNPLLDRNIRMTLNRILKSRIYKFIALSELHKKFLIESEKIPADKLEVINNGIDIGIFEEYKTEKSDKELIIGTVAALRPEKAHDRFLKAAKIVLKKCPNVQFQIIGDGPERNNLETMARNLKIEKSIEFLGFRNDIPELMHNLDIFVLTSVYEVFPMSILEAMAAGKPVVATNVGSVSDIIINGETGFIVNNGHVDGIAKRIVRLLRDDKLRNQMGETSNDRVKKYFSINRMANKYENIFEKLKNSK